MSAGWQTAIRICIIQGNACITSSYLSFLTANLNKVNIILNAIKGMFIYYTITKNPTHFDPSAVLKIGTRRILVTVEFIAHL